MKDIIVIVGLPGSGKTTFVEKNFCNYILFDDVGDNPELFNRLRDWKECERYRNNFLIITDVHSCDLREREALKNKLKSFGLNPVFMFFENDPFQCIQNVQLRADDDKPVSARFIHRLSEKYNPSGIILKVYRGELRNENW